MRDVYITTPVGQSSHVMPLTFSAVTSHQNTSLALFGPYYISVPVVPVTPLMTTTQQIPTYSIVEPSRQSLHYPFLSGHQIAPTSAQPLIFNTTTCNETSDQSQGLYTQTLPCPVDPAIFAIGHVVSGKEQYDLPEERDNTPRFTPFEENLPQPTQLNNHRLKPVG